MQSRTLSDSRIDELRENLMSMFGADPIPDDAMVRLIEYEEGVVTVDGTPSFFYVDDAVIPLIPMLLNDNFLSSITVDMGAVKPVVSGADIMVPGIVSVEDGVEDGDVVSVVDEDNGKPIAVVQASMTSEEIRSSSQGVAASSLHYVGDDVWDACCN